MSVFQESGGMDFEDATMGGGLTARFGLNFGPDILWFPP